MPDPAYILFLEARQIGPDGMLYYVRRAMTRALLETAAVGAWRVIANEAGVMIYDMNRTLGTAFFDLPTLDWEVRLA